MGGAIMRVLLDNRIWICTLATLSGNGKEVYTVNMVRNHIAKECHKQLLRKGYFDFTGYEYSD